MLYIYGHGGFAREVNAFLKKEYAKNYVEFVVDDEYYNEQEKSQVISYSTFIDCFDKSEDEIVVAIGDPADRKSIVQKLHSVDWLLNYSSFPNLLLKKSLKGRCIVTSAYQGNIFCPGSIITCNITIGSHNHFNLNTTIGHDCIIGDYNTFSPGVNISGNVTIGDECYFGTNCSVRQGVTICNQVTIGMGAVVLNDITEPGTYVGVPCKKIQ